MTKDLLNKYYKKIKLLNETLWEHKVSKQKIDDWLDNFEENEKVQALFLLTQFIYFNQFQVKALLKAVYRDLFKYKEIEKIRMENNNTLNNELINNKFQEVLSKTRFVALGNVSESSSYLMYPFRQLNKLSDELFFTENDIAIRIEEVDHFVFIDDICGSGSQAIDYSSNVLPLIHEHFPDAKTSYFILVSTKEGKKNIIDYTGYDYVDSILELDNTYRCFDDESRVFENKDPLINVDLIKDFSGAYGKTLMKSISKQKDPDATEEELEEISEENKFGFSNGQLLIGFNHNTPDNTMPILWYNEDEINWTPIFERNNKI